MNFVPPSASHPYPALPRRNRGRRAAETPRPRLAATALLLGLLLATTCLATAERINHEGRLLGPAPGVTAPTLFNTPQADALLSAMQVLPVDNPWNEDISRRPVLANSDAMIAQIMADLSSSRRTLRAFFEMNFVLVPDAQPLVPIDLFNYADESDPGPYPIPSNLPIETWPRETGALTLSEWQQDINGDGGDRHAILVQPGAGFLWETWLTRRVGSNWEASNGAKFDLKGNTLRPATWTSGDAAGLPMFPALVRFDECQRGAVEHAVRLVVKHTRAEFIYPARHYASSPYTTDPNVPAMGQRLRLKAGVVIPDNWANEEKAVLRALKKYGALVADNGNFFSISVTPDDRWPADAFSHLSSVSITHFEVIQTTGLAEGPRSPGAPVADAGPDRTVAFGTPVRLAGHVAHSNPAPVIQWRLQSGPGTATFTDEGRTNSSVTLSAPGPYTLMLSADDGVHAVSYDAVVITVTTGLRLSISRAGPDVEIGWIGGTPPFNLETSPTLSPARWDPVTTTLTPGVTVPRRDSATFFRVRGS